MKPIVMRPDEWEKILYVIKTKEKPSTYLSRTKMREVLGFTVRNHRDYDKSDPYDYHYAHTVRLDFYDEKMRTMFLLKYGNGQD